MIDDAQTDLLSSVNELRLVQLLLADLHDDLAGKVARFRQLSDLSASLGAQGTMIPGEIAALAWSEARTSFINGNYVATVMLCQSLAEHMLASELTMALNAESLRDKITFAEVLQRSIDKKIIPEEIARDLRHLVDLRNPLVHFKDVNDRQNITRRAIESRVSHLSQLFADACFAIALAIRLLSLPGFRIDK